MDLIKIVLLAYLLLVFGAAWFFSRKESLKTYFLNDKKTGLWLMVFSTVSSIIGAGATVAIVSEVYNSGISYGIALPTSLILGVVVLGILAKKIKVAGDKHKFSTIPDFFGARFDRKNRILAVILQLFTLVVWTGVQAIAIASLASVLTGMDYTIALFLSGIITILYTAIGGLKVDIITDFIQFWIITIVFLITSVLAYTKAGGLVSILSQVPKDHLDIFGFGGISWFLGSILLGGFVYLANTHHWQRIISAKNETLARKSFFLSIPFVALISVSVLVMGLSATVLLSSVKKETAIFSLMNVILPSSLVGIGFAAILAVIMSSIDSILIGGSTIIYDLLFKKKKDNLLIARIITASFGIFGFSLALLVPNIITLSLLVSYLVLIFVPAIIGGFYSKRLSADASFCSLIIPSALLFILFPFTKEQTFIITTPLSILIILSYDKLFKRKSKRIKK